MAQLNMDEFASSTAAIKDFMKDLSEGKRGNEFEVRVGVEDTDGNNLFVFDNVDIIFGYNVNYHKVDIMWEPFLGKNYKKHNLYGRYSTTFNKMEYSYKELTIFSDDRIIILQG